MKKITFLFAFLLMSIIGFAQQVVIENFEDSQNFTYSGFEGLSSASIVADPVSGGTRTNGLKLVSISTGNPWQGAQVVLSTKKIKLTTDKTVQIDVYSTQEFNLLAKVEEGGSAPVSAASQDYTTPNAWQTLTFTFNQSLDNTGVANGEYAKIVFFPNWKATDDGFNNPANFSIHLDNITAEEAQIAPDPAPTTAAPTPPSRAAADVKSIFSGAYTPIVSDMNYAGVDGQTSNDNTFNTSWCGATTTLVQIDGNDTNKVTGLGCEGVSFLAGRFDATDFTHFHIDMWTSSATLDKSFNIKFSNWNGGTQETNALEYSMTNANVLTNPNPETWYSFDIPLSSFTCVGPAGNPCPSRSDFTQFIITSDLGTVFYDNLYLHKNTVLNTNNFNVSKVKLYPNPASNILNIEAAAAIQNLSIVNILGQEVISRTASENMVSLDVSNLQNGIYIVKTVIDGVASSTKFIKE